MTDLFLVEKSYLRSTVASYKTPISGIPLVRLSLVHKNSGLSRGLVSRQREEINTFIFTF